MSDIERRTDRLAALREHVERLPGYEGELGTHVLAASPERLIERSPKTTARRIDAVNMATVYGKRDRRVRNRRLPGRAGDPRAPGRSRRDPPEHRKG